MISCPKRLPLALLAWLTLSALGCGETNRQAIARMTAPYAERRSELRTVISRLPPRGTLQSDRLPTSLEPPLLLDYANRLFNTDVLNLDEFQQEAGAQPEHAGFELHLSHRLSYCLAWTGPRNPLHPDAMSDRGHLGEECESALRYPYLVLVRVARNAFPERVDFEAFVVETRTGRLLGEFLVPLHSRLGPEDLGTGEFREEALRRLHTRFYLAAQCVFARKLSLIPDSRVRLERTCAPDSDLESEPSVIAR